jgi:hypothetical protein
MRDLGFPHQYNSRPPAPGNSIAAPVSSVVRIPLLLPPVDLNRAIWYDSSQPRAMKPAQSAKGWPPPYAKPQGPIDEEDPDAGALLYKFAGRWDHVSSNTLTNIYLKPDGTYEEAYEAGYSGIYTDDGGYQTGNWAAAGNQNESGQWSISGGLRKGTLRLVDRSGKETAYQYQVHVKDGEVYWGEYFFNGKLHSVNYIYR